jgi:hypothetical protein
MPRLHSTCLAPIPLVAALLGALPGAARAQIRLDLGVGVLAGTNLVRDSLAAPTAARPNPAPVVTLGFDAPLDPTYRLGLEVEAARSTLALHGDSSAAITTLTVWRPALRLSRDLGARLSMHVTVGVMLYAPSNRTATFFAAGTTPEPVAGIGITVRQRIGGAFALGLAVDYDVHRFTTTALTAQGFSGASTVQRVAVTLHLIRLGHARP